MRTDDFLSLMSSILTRELKLITKIVTQNILGVVTDLSAVYFTGTNSF